MSTQKTSTRQLSNCCPVCKGRGWKFVTDNDGYEIMVECECGTTQKEMKKKLISFADIPESFQNMDLASYSTTIYLDKKSRKIAETALKAVNYWINSFENMQERGMGFYFYSNTKGSGKTRLAASIANELIQKKRLQVKFCTSLQILNEIKASWNQKESEYSESKLLDFLSTSKILIIDDFGTEQADKDWVNERFYQIINNRYINKKITIFTSNERLDLLKYDSRITNRIKERTFQIPFPEESVREIIAKSNMEELIQGIRNTKK